MSIEKEIIKLIKSLDRIMDTWSKLTLRRTIVSIFTTIILIQVIITTILWILGKEISTAWMGILGVEFGAWGTILAYYFNIRGKSDEKINNSRMEGKKEDDDIEG
ncbi:MAG: hypothetical protein RBQ86_08070 [Candidatus Izemoplasmatales bacterium]|jgi:hypothetical protein|nr:hypothetical protein [Candidatus Izemoplasmatales bacterium]